MATTSTGAASRSSRYDHTHGTLSNRQLVRFQSIAPGAMHACANLTVIIVACLASFRALFSNKERAREAEEALERERDMNGCPSLNLRVMKARAKHFQDSLLTR